MPDFTPIPIPLKQRWRQFRTQMVPVLVFVCATVSMFWLWDRQGTPGTVMGEVHAPLSSVYSPVIGCLEGVPLELFRPVEAGEVIARVRNIPAEQAALQMAVLHEELKMIRLGVGEPVINQQRNLISLHGLRRDWMLARSDLAVLEVRIRQADADTRRIAKLVATGAESLSVLEQSQALHGSLVAERVEKTQLGATLERAVEQARVADGLNAEPGIGAGIAAALDWKEAELRQLESLLRPTDIIAPFAGRITRIYRHIGDYVNVGEVIAELRAVEADSIIGYMKQPLQVTPQVGMQVEITPRGAGGARGGVGRATIVGVGPQFEPLQPAFMRVMPLTMEERGLPVKISLPSNPQLIPGQIVDIRLPQTTQ